MIVRIETDDGAVIERPLTEAELERAHNEYEKNKMLEEIEACWFYQGMKLPMPDNFPIEKVMEESKWLRSKDDCYMDARWDSIMKAVASVIEEYVQQLWDEFGDVPLNPNTECIEIEWMGFPAGTHREEIWHWFENSFGVRVYNLLY